MIPKNHWAFDVAEQMVADNFVVDAFTLERLHLRAKAIATHCKHLGSYEASLMAGIVNTHVCGMLDNKQWSSNCHLLAPVVAVPWCPNIFISDKAECFGSRFQMDCFVFRGGISSVVVCVVSNV